MTRKYFPNNWRAIADSPDEFFPNLSYEEFESWKIHGYMIPDSVDSMMRITDPKTGRITEKIYSSHHHCRQRIKKAITNGEEFVLCTNEGLYHLKPNDLPLDFNNKWLKDFLSNITTNC